MSTAPGYVVIPSQHVAQPESEGFFHRHWKLFLSLCLLVFLMPLAGCIIQILHAIFSLGSGFGEAIKDLLGPFIKLLEAGDQQCEQSPNSWQCWLFKGTEVILPFFYLIFSRMGVGGKLRDWLKNLAGNENRSEMDIGREIARSARQDLEQALKDPRIPEEMKKDPKFVKVLAERFVAIRLRKAFQDFYNSLNDPDVKSKVEQAAAKAQKDCEDAENQARDDISDDAKKKAEDILPKVPDFKSTPKST